MAEIPVDPLQIIKGYGPHLSSMTGVRLSTSVEPERLVKTHCCFCGQQCGIQLKVLDNQVIGFEPWEDFPFNRGMRVRRLQARAQRLTIVYGIVCFVLVLVIGQLWLLTATMNAFLGGDQRVALPALLASLVCFALNVGLLRYLR